MDPFAILGTLKSLLQDHSPNPVPFDCDFFSKLRPSAFFIVQLSHLYMTTGKTIAMTGRTFGGKGISLIFNVLSWLVLAFLPSSKPLLLSWLRSPSSVITVLHFNMFNIISVTSVSARKLPRVKKLLNKHK